MSRGIGKTQQAILDMLADERLGSMNVVEVCRRLLISGPQARRAVRALESRGLVAVSREHIGWKGVGEYGRLMVKGEGMEDIPTALSLKEDDEIPWAPGFVANRDFEAFYTGMPVFGLRVWLPDYRASYLRFYLTRKMQETSSARRMTAPIEELAEYERLTGTDFLDSLR